MPSTGSSGPCGGGFGFAFSCGCNIALVVVGLPEGSCEPPPLFAARADIGNVSAVAKIKTDNFRIVISIRLKQRNMQSDALNAVPQFHYSTLVVHAKGHERAATPQRKRGRSTSNNGRELDQSARPFRGVERPVVALPTRSRS
jgi:hypothetical protein